MCFQPYDILEKEKNTETVKRSLIIRGEREMSRQNTEHFQSSKTKIYDAIIVETCHIHLSKLTECKPPRMNSSVNYKLSDNDMSV